MRGNSLVGCTKDAGSVSAGGRESADGADARELDPRELLAHPLDCEGSSALSLCQETAGDAELLWEGCLERRRKVVELHVAVGAIELCLCVEALPRGAEEDDWCVAGPVVCCDEGQSLDSPRRDVCDGVCSDEVCGLAEDDAVVPVGLRVGNEVWEREAVHAEVVDPPDRCPLVPPVEPHPAPDEVRHEPRPCPARVGHEDVHRALNPRQALPHAVHQRPPQLLA